MLTPGVCNVSIKITAAILTQYTVDGGLVEDTQVHHSTSIDLCSG